MAKFADQFGVDSRRRLGIGSDHGVTWAVLEREMGGFGGQLGRVSGDTHFAWAIRCAKHYEIIRAYLQRRGETIGANDFLIAATALAHGATVITRNLIEFQRVPGLRVEGW